MDSTDDGLDQALDRVDQMHDRQPPESFRLGDSREGLVYRDDERVRSALKVALITGRPLLLVGPPGCGKSSLAPFVANNLGMRLLSYTVTEESEPSDLLWHIDHVQRLSDAQAHDAKPISQYVNRGVLWEAFQPDMNYPVGGTVVLIDEIDKAEPAFANSLLVAIGSLTFDVPPLKAPVKADDRRLLLVIFTSNQERALPIAFMRRCITLDVGYPSADALVEIVGRWFPSWIASREFADAVQALAVSLIQRAELVGAHVTTAEFIDLIQVLRKTGLDPSSEEWRTVEGLVMTPLSDEWIGVS